MMSDQVQAEAPKRDRPYTKIVNRTSAAAPVYGLGFIGALLGTYLAHAAGLPELFAIQIGGKPFPIIWSIIGSALFVAILSLITRRRVY